MYTSNPNHINVCQSDTWTRMQKIYVFVLLHHVSYIMYHTSYIIHRMQKIYIITCKKERITLKRYCILCICTSYIIHRISCFCCLCKQEKQPGFTQLRIPISCLVRIQLYIWCSYCWLGLRWWCWWCCCRYNRRLIMYYYHHHHHKSAHCLIWQQKWYGADYNHIWWIR